MLFSDTPSPDCSHEDDIYSIRPLTEEQVMATYTSILMDACRYADRLWHTSAFDPDAGYWGTGRGGWNHDGMRGISEMVVACGAVLKYCDALSESERRNYGSKAIGAIRYAVATHVTGTEHCTDGVHWGDYWQSDYWAGMIGFGAWLTWDSIDSDLRAAVERVVAFEADRSLGSKPPTGRWFDTKAEENGWTATCIVLAANMFASHPHAAAWDEKAIEYLMNTLSVPRDLNDKKLVDGRPIWEWVSGANLNPDFTLENHGIFHLSYVQCSCYFLTQCAMLYAYAGRPIPQATRHHLMDTWRMFQTFMLPSGETAFPQGMDWELHGLPPTNLLASLARYMKDPLAAGMEKINLQYMHAWQEMGDGDLAVPGSRLGFTRHAIQSAQTAHCYLAHQLFESAADQETTIGRAAPELCCSKRYSSVGIVLHRTENKLATFSWKNRIMGMLVPIGQGHEANPHVTVPITNGLIGSIQLSGDGEPKTRLLERAWKTTPNGFETSGTLSTNGGMLKQALRIDSVGEKALVYQDCVTALSDVYAACELGVPLGIENDRVTGGSRTVYHRDGATVFDWQRPQPPTALPGSWANVDGRLGIVAVAGSGLAYTQAVMYDPGMAVYADVLYGSFSHRPRTFRAGSEVVRRIILFFVEVTPDETSVLAQSVRIEGAPGSQMLRFGLPEGGVAEVPLNLAIRTDR